MRSKLLTLALLAALPLAGAGCQKKAEKPASIWEGGQLLVQDCIEASKKDSEIDKKIKEIWPAKEKQSQLRRKLCEAVQAKGALGGSVRARVVQIIEAARAEKK